MVRTIQNGLSPLQSLQAQRAFQPKNAEKPAVPFELPDFDEVAIPQDQVQLSSQRLPALEVNTLHSQQSDGLKQPKAVRATQAEDKVSITEVQTIAQKVGYVGVTERDIQRAYTLGSSLLADYRA